MKRAFVSVVCGCILSAVLAGAATAEEDAVNVRSGTTAQKGQPSSGVFTLEAEIGLGYDSNIYEAPNAAYTDYAAIGGPVAVTPVTYSGFFVPIAFRADYAGSLDPAVRFLASYRYWMDKYLSSARDNADSWTHKLRAGLELVTGKQGRKEDTFYLGPFLSMHDQTYYDHDSGSDKVTTAGEDIAGRYSYNALGFEAEYRKRTVKLPFSITAEYESRDYDDPVAVSEYDNNRVSLGGEVEFPLGRRLELDVQYTYAAVDYDDRHARNAQGQLFASAPLLSYTYHTYGLSLRKRFSKDTVAYLDYDRTGRTDGYVGYNDYTGNEYAVRLIYAGIENTRLRVKLALWNRDYPNAFAFDDAGQPQKTYDGVDATVKGEYALNKAWGLWAEFKSRDQGSTDLRYDYSKYQALIGVSWKR